MTEATNVSPNYCAFEKVPGIYNDAQVQAWRHERGSRAGGRIFMQLWHGGRVGADAILEGQQLRAPSAVNDDLDALQVWGLMATAGTRALQRRPLAR